MYFTPRFHNYFHNCAFPNKNLIMQLVFSEKGKQSYELIVQRSLSINNANSKLVLKIASGQCTMGNRIMLLLLCIVRCFALIFGLVFCWAEHGFWSRHVLAQPPHINLGTFSPRIHTRSRGCQQPHKHYQ